MRTLEQYQLPIMFSMSHLGSNQEQFSEQIGISTRQIATLSTNDEIKRIYILGLNYLIGQHDRTYAQCDYPVMDSIESSKEAYVTEGEINSYAVKLIALGQRDSPCSEIRPLFKMMESAFISKEILYATFEREDSRQYVYDLEKLIISHTTKGRLKYFNNEFEFEVIVQNHESSIEAGIYLKRSYRKDDEEDISDFGNWRNHLSDKEIKVASLTIDKNVVLDKVNLSKTLYMMMLLKFSVKLTRRCHSMYKKQRADLYRNHKILLELNKEHRQLLDTIAVLLEG